ncbi:MAG: hypothetical protein KIS82_10515 [Ferruginibacter sp.]|nr:hypothetical protein [Bacteroidota bacterium]MCW5917767.1 hypothetical protein [Ferruginibacter sp.]
MALKFFLVYIGVFFAFAIGFLMLAKNFASSLGAAGKKPLLEGGLSALLISGFAYGVTVFVKHLFAVFWIFAALFILFGIFHILFFHKKYFYKHNIDKTKATVAEILFMLSLLFIIIVFFSALQYFLKDKNFLFFPTLMCMLAFFIPLSILYSFEAAYNIPPTEYPTWKYPLYHPIDLPDERPNEKLLVIAFEAAKAPTDKVRTNFRAKGPETMKLGDLFYHFINDYNEIQSETPIQYADQENSAFDWGFRIRPRGIRASQILDPELSMRENGIRENSIIICERI